MGNNAAEYRFVLADISTDQCWHVLSTLSTEVFHKDDLAATRLI